MKAPFVAIGVVIASFASVSAQSPAAIVEDVRGKVSGVEFMDYVAPGKVINLGNDGVVVLGYMKSCWRETIKGGVAVVGTEESRTAHSDVSREKVACDAPRVDMSDHEAIQSAATTFRSMGKMQQVQPARFPIVYGLSPVIELPLAGKLVIEPINVHGERIEVVVSRNMLVKGRFYDFAAAGKSLIPGGTYVATLGTRRTVFKVDALARAGASPIIGRLVRL